VNTSTMSFYLLAVFTIIIPIDFVKRQIIVEDQNLKFYYAERFVMIYDLAALLFKIDCFEIGADKIIIYMKAQFSESPISTST
jgi:hypothetical protein